MKHNIYTFQFVQGLIILAIGLWGIRTFIQVDPVMSLAVLVIGIVVSLVFIEVISMIPSTNFVSKILFREW